MVGDWYQDSADKSHSDGLIPFTDRICPPKMDRSNSKPGDPGGCLDMRGKGVISILVVLIILLH